MKRILFSLLLTLVTGQMMAQVRLPERPNRPQYVDHSELDNGFWCAIEGKVGSSIQFNANNAQRAGLTFTGGYMVNEYFDGQRYRFFLIYSKKWARFLHV